MLAHLTQLLAREDAALRPIAEYFAEAGLSGAGGGAFRVWPWDVYSEATGERVKAGQLDNGVRWSEWSMGF